MDYKLSLFISFLKIIYPVLMISFVSFFFIRLLKIEDSLEKIIILFLFNWSQILICIQLLSLFNKVTLISVVIFHFIEILICLIILAIIKKVNFKINLRIVISKFKYFFKSVQLNKIIVIIIIIWMAIIIFTTFFTGIISPPTNYDSMTYHLARAAFWKQNHNINHYVTTAEIQNENPLNAEIGLLWIMLFTNSDNITFLVQWICFLIILITLYKLLRLLNFNKAISLITVFVFSTLDIVLLEASSTQNDLVAACFIVLTLYFLIRMAKSEQIDFRYITLSSIALGMAIGIKGNSYLIIPGFIIFLIVFGKNNKIKFIKLAYLLLFSIFGIILFSGYGIIQNYLSYKNIFSANDNLDLVKIPNPDFKTFISSFTKQISSFYQLNNSKFDFFGKYIREAVINIHKKIGMDLSSPVTTWPGVVFYFSNIKLNFDESYFGPFYFFIILPSLFYNMLLFIIFRLWKKGKEFTQRFKESLLVLIVPVVYFLLYVFIFKWQPYTGRHMIIFAVITMVSFALLMDFIFQINKRYLFQFISSILIITTAILSFFPLFKGDYIHLINYNFNVKYEDRRGNFAKDELTLLNENLKHPYNIGLILRSGDWVYVLFGNDYSNKLSYISADEWNKNNIKEILSLHNYDGILVNKNSEVFITQKYNSISSKFTGNFLLEINNNNFNNFLKPLHDCNLIKSQNGILMESLSDDPYFETNFPLNSLKNKEIIIKVSLISNIESNAQFFYKFNNKEYNEDDSIRINLLKGKHNFYIYVNDTDKINKVRFDLLDKKGEVLINNIQIFSIDKSVRYKELGNYILFY